MNETSKNSLDFNRRDFLRSGSLATMMTMLGGVELLGQTNAAPAAESQAAGPKLKVALIGLGPWGRETLTTLLRVPQADVAAICDNYPAMVKRGSNLAPGIKTTPDYKTILADTEIKAVIVATGTHQHKDIVLEALKAGKHVYCEAPLAHTIEDAATIAKAAKAANQVIFQAGLQLRADPQRHFLLPFIRSGALGKWVKARAQYHRKQSWRFPASTPEREKAINWRLEKDLSTGLVGEFGCHPLDQAMWYMNARPVAVTGFGAIAFWKDNREVPDTIEAVFEFPEGVCMTYEATLANSFDSEYEMLYGSDAAIMMRESKAWMFKEVDAPLLGWEVYARKDSFGKETGIVLQAGASKSVTPEQGAAQAALPNTPLFYALQVFVRNSLDLSAKKEEFVGVVGDSDPEGLAAELVKVPRRAAAGYLEGYQATALGIKANEAVLARKRLELKPELYELA